VQTPVDMSASVTLDNLPKQLGLEQQSDLQEALGGTLQRSKRSQKSGTLNIRWRDTVDQNVCCIDGNFAFRLRSFFLILLLQYRS
jgi:hypothetical protein